MQCVAAAGVSSPWQPHLIPSPGKLGHNRCPSCARTAQTLGETVLRITPVATTNGSKRLKVEGRLAGPFVEELARAATGDRSETVAIDLADVTFVDQRGVELLRSLRMDGV